MVVIREFVRVQAPVRRRRPTGTDCEYAVFDGEQRGRMLELATTGSEQRVSQGRRSQTIQLDKRAGLELLALMEEVFGIEAMHLPARSRTEGVELDLGAEPFNGPPAIDLQWSSDDVIFLPAMVHADLSPAPEQEPQFDEHEDGVLRSTGAAVDSPQRSSSPELNRAIERSAVELVKRSLENSGWTFTRDRQRDGVGYDLEFKRGGELRKVEVKGIRGERLVFNLTPKEFWRAQEDPAFVVVAVTGALDTRKHRLHVLSRERVLAAHRTAVGYRIRPGTADARLPGETTGDGGGSSWH